MKDFLLRLIFFSSIKMRSWWRFIGLFVFLFSIVFIAAFFLSRFEQPELASVFYSLLCFIVGLGGVLLLCRVPFFQRGIMRNIIFVAILLLGISAYYCLHCYETQTRQDSTQSVIVRAIYHHHLALAAFFPSRGGYEISTDGVLGSGFSANGEPVVVETAPLVLYFAFHTLVYMFAGYFLMSLWGCRTINRLQFWLTRDCEKNIFWCEKPEPKMLKLAKDLQDKARVQPVFSVDEFGCADPKLLFQEMNFQEISLKLRKPGQIHTNCLRAARHFFLSENSDWNVNMAQSFLERKKEKKIAVKTELYIKINNDARKRYFFKWADQHKNDNTEIIFIDECSLIAAKLIKEHHLLNDLSENIVRECAAVKKEKGFNVLLIGFGGLGQEILRHLICDSRFFNSKGELLDFHADIVDQDAAVLSLFQERYAAMCKHADLKLDLTFYQKNVGSGVFYSFLKRCLTAQDGSYDRVIIALGDAALNIEVAAAIESIIRVNINLNNENPDDELLKWKKKIFLVSPEINSSVPALISSGIFTLVGADNEIYTCADIVNEEKFYLARLVHYRYCVTDPKKMEELGSAEIKKEIEKAWQTADMYSRQSAYAAALGLENISKLLVPDGNDSALGGILAAAAKTALKTRLCELEHLRWWAFLLGQGYSTWVNPCQHIRSVPKANQTGKFLRHAAMIPSCQLTEIDGIFREILQITLRRGDTEIKLEALAEPKEENESIFQLHGILTGKTLKDNKTDAVEKTQAKVLLSSPTVPALDWGEVPDAQISGGISFPGAEEMVIKKMNKDASCCIEITSWNSEPGDFEGTLSGGSFTDGKKLVMKDWEIIESLPVLLQQSKKNPGQPHKFWHLSVIPGRIPKLLQLRRRSEKI